MTYPSNSNLPQNNQARQQQITSNSLTNTGVEVQGLTITDSHDVTVQQTEVQGLLLIQAALQAAVEASIIILGHNEYNNLRQLQALSQALSVSKVESQTITINGSDGITVSQTEVQVDAVVQAAINLLAQLLLKIG